MHLFRPAAHRVTAWLSDGSVAATCRWTAGSPVYVDPKQSPKNPKSDFTAPCSARVSLFVPNEQTVQINVAGDPAGDASEKLLVDNIIVVGLGDFMASGEGNPDVKLRECWAERDKTGSLAG